MTDAFRVLIALALVGPAAISDASAQSSWLGGRGTETAARRELLLDTAGFGALDFRPATEAPSDPLLATDDRLGSGGANLQLSYRDRAEYLSLEASAASSFRYYSTSSAEWVPGYSGLVRLSSREGVQDRLTWQVSQDLSYAPLNTLFFFPGDSFGSGFDSTAGVAPIPSVDYQISEQMQLVSSTSGGTTYRLSRRSALSADLSYGFSDAPATSDGQFRRWSAGGGYSYQRTRYLTLNAGYGYSASWDSGNPTEESPMGEGLPGESLTSDGPTSENLRGEQSPRTYNLDLGMNYSRPLSFSRRTRVSFASGATGVSNRNQDVQYRAIGNAGVTHEFGRSWTAGASYDRNVQFVPTFVDPLFSDGVTVGVQGRVTRTSGAQLSATWSKGTVGIPSDDNDYATTSFSAQYRHGITRTLGAYAEYIFFDSTFGSGVELPRLVPGSQRRQGIRVGVSFQVNVYRDGR